MMNKEVIKAMNRKPKEKNKLRKWWDKNNYKVMRVILFPIWFIVWTYEKVTKWLDNRQKWNEERTNEILSYYIPRRAEWDKDEQEFYFFDNGYGWSINFAKKYLKRKDRRFWKNHKGFCGGEIREYLINNFELECFTKEVLDTSDFQTEIIFKKNK